LGLLLKPGDEGHQHGACHKLFAGSVESFIIVTAGNSATRALDQGTEDRQSAPQCLSSAKTAYIFRCGESGLYAFTLDPNGHALPSRLYPAIRWRFDRSVTLLPDGISPRGYIARAVLAAIAQHGFHLTHVAVNAELHAVSEQHQED
jgi:hypothetical protein